jgi:ATP synthase protein I
MAEAMRTVGPVMSVGFAFVFALGIGYGIGIVLDGWTGLAPWFTVIFSLMGLAAGVLTVVRVVRDAMRG